MKLSIWSSGTVIYSIPVLFFPHGELQEVVPFLNSVICEWLAWTKTRLGMTGTSLVDFIP